MGATTVVCGVKAEIAEPELDRESEGFLGVYFFLQCPSGRWNVLIPIPPVPNLDLPAMCSPKFKPGPPSEEAQVLSDRLNQVLISCVPSQYMYTAKIEKQNVCRSNLLPLSSLCIHPGKSAWVLYVDATCINYDGNAFDATLLAMVAALRNSSYGPTVWKISFC
jgi:exosome complex component RRP43